MPTGSVRRARVAPPRATVGEERTYALSSTWAMPALLAPMADSGSEKVVEKVTPSAAALGRYETRTVGERSADEKHAGAAGSTTVARLAAAVVSAITQSSAPGRGGVESIR